MTTLHDTLNDLEEKAKKATPGPIEARLNPETGAWHLVHTSVPRGLNGGCYSHILYCDKTDAEYIAACSPEMMLALITALREAEEALKRIENPVLPGRPSYADWELRLIARDWLAKYAKGEK